jgi:CBS-domain-containing membrane protein
MLGRHVLAPDGATEGPMFEPTFYVAPPARARLRTPSAAPALPSTAPALDAMTDLATEAAHVVAGERGIDDALRDMIGFGVRLLFVVDDHDVVGVVTSYDITGERPIQFLQDPFRSGKPHRHADITVADIMTPVAEIRPLRLAWVAGVTVADVAALFRSRPDMHLLVAEDEPGGGVMLRGIFSRTRLERQLDGH